MSRWCVLRIPCRTQTPLTRLGCAQPAVDDPETIQLVNDKVEAFWRSVESGAGKRGQVCALPVSPAEP